MLRANSAEGLIKIQNVVSTADLKQPVTIKEFNSYPWGRFDLVNNYNGKVGYIKNDKMHGRVTIFSSGKMISTGTKSIAQSIDNIQISLNLLVRNHFVNYVRLIPQIRNIVATLDLGCNIDLSKVVQCMSKCIFEPEQFPAVIYKPNTGPCFLIFASGKVVIVGAKSRAHLSQLSDLIVTRLDRFCLR